MNHDKCSLNEASSVITGALITLKNLFDASQNLYSKKEITSGKYVDIYFPRKLGLNIIDGIKLKGDMGFISVHEQYIKDGRSFKRVAYNYRYITATRSYDFSHRSNGSSRLECYYFHYDMDLEYKNTDGNTGHSQFHLQVLHDSPRFQTEEIKIVDFLNFIRDSFYLSSSLDPKQEALF